MVVNSGSAWPTGEGLLVLQLSDAEDWQAGALIYILAGGVVPNDGLSSSSHFFF